MRTFILLAISTAVASPAAAFGQQRSNQDTAAGMRQATVGQDSFIQKAVMSDSAEIALGTLAQDRSHNKDVQDFAKEMVKDHSKSSKDLRDAVGGTVNFPSELDQAHLALVKRLSDLNGDEFDREYIQAMVTEHQKAVELLQTKTDESGQKMASRGNETGGPNVSSDAAVSEWATKTLPVVKDHLEKAQDLQKKLGNNASQAGDANGSAGYQPPSSQTDTSSGSRGRGQADSSSTGSMSPR